MTPIELANSARRNFREFVSIVAHLAETAEFDAIIGAGNSGLAMAHIARLVYEEMRLKVPQIIPVAVFRDGDRVTNQIARLHLSPDDDIRGSLPGQFASGRVLYVDDEIGAGRVAVAAMRAVTRLAGRPLAFTVVAEDHRKQGFTFPADIHVERFMGFGSNRLGCYSVIFHVVPRQFQERIKGVIGPQEDDIKYATNLLLGLPTKEVDNGNWHFIHKYDEQVAANIHDFTRLRGAYRKLLRRLIQTTLRVTHWYLLPRELRYKPFPQGLPGWKVPWASPLTG